MSKSTDFFIEHVLNEIKYLEEASNGVTEDQFMRDDTLMRAFARSLEIIGEAIKSIDEETKKNYSTIDWKSFAGLRDKLIHHYYGIDYFIVWDVIVSELPELKHQLEKITTSR